MATESEDFASKDFPVDFSLVKRAVPTLVVESYEQIFPYIQRTMKSRRMPSSGMKLMYLDSHPQLCVPDVPFKDLKTDSKLAIEKLNRRDWILPHVHSGLFDFVLWQHPTWCGQILDRQPTEYLVGEDEKSGRLCTNIPETYFYREGAFCHECNMKSPKKFTLMVAPIHETHTMCRVCENILREVINKPFILIIDLSSSSTKNPFQNKFTKDELQLIDQLYVPVPPITIEIPPEELTSASVIEERGMLAADILNSARRHQLYRLRRWINTLGNGYAIDSKPVLALWPKEIVDLCTLLLSVGKTQKDHVKLTPMSVEAIEKTLKSANEQLNKYGENLPPVALASMEDGVRKALGEFNISCDDSEDLFSFDFDDVFKGPLDFLHKLFLETSEDPEMPTFDDNIMVEIPKTEEEIEAEKHLKTYPPFFRMWHPEYVSTKEQQERLCDDQESLLNRIHNPYLIFVIRSSKEGFTPEDQVHDIFIDQMYGLARIYGPKILAIALDYENPERDAEILTSSQLNVISIEDVLHRIDNPPWPVKEPAPEQSTSGNTSSKTYLPY